MCNTEQNYVGGDSHATGNEQAVNSDPQTAQVSSNVRPKSLWFGDASTQEGRHTVTTLSTFGGMMTRPKEVNRLRQDVRAWFSAYIPTADDSLSECDLKESIANYEALDNFLSALVSEGIELIAKGGRKR